MRRGRVRRAKLYYLRDLRGKSARIVEKKTDAATMAAEAAAAAKAAAAPKAPKAPKVVRPVKKAAPKKK